MTTTDSKKFRSPFHGIDLKLLRMLCDLHPWSMADLCKAVDMEPSVLSMVLAGRRPLPIRVARPFLELMGMKEDGSLDQTHGFIFVEKPGREAVLREVHDRLFPEPPVACQLSVSVSDPDDLTKPPYVKLGFVLFEQGFVAVVHAGAGSHLSTWWSSSERVRNRYHEAPEKLLSTTELPSRVDMLRAFMGMEIEIDPTWDAVISEAKSRNVEARDVMAWLKTNFSTSKN